MGCFSLSTDEPFLIRVLSDGKCIQKSETTNELKKLAGICTESFYIDSQNCLVHSQTRQRISTEGSPGGDNKLQTNNEGCTKISHGIDGKLKTGDKCFVMVSGVLKEDVCSSIGEKEFVLERGNNNIGQSMSYIVRKIT